MLICCTDTYQGYNSNLNYSKGVFVSHEYIIMQHSLLVSFNYDNLRQTTVLQVLLPIGVIINVHFTFEGTKAAAAPEGINPTICW